MPIDLPQVIVYTGYKEGKSAVRRKNLSFLMKKEE